MGLVLADLSDKIPAPVYRLMLRPIFWDPVANPLEAIDKHLKLLSKVKRQEVFSSYFYLFITQSKCGK